MQNKILKIILTIMSLALLLIGVMFTITIEVPITSKELPNNYEIKASDITTKRVLKNSINNETYVNALDVLGKQTNVHLDLGSVFTYSNISNKVQSVVNEDSDSLVTMPLAIDPTHAPDALQKGDIINLLFYFSPNVINDDNEAFAIGFNYIATVNSVLHDSDGYICKVDVLVSKDIAVDIATSTSLGQLFIIKNSEINNINLKGASASDILAKYYTAEIESINEAAKVESAEELKETKESDDSKK